MTDDNLLPFSFPAVSRKQVAGAFDGGRVTSDGGDRRAAPSHRREIGALFPDRRDPTRITHTLVRFDFDRSESDDGDLDAKRCQSVGANLVVENLDALIELGDRLTRHGA